MDLRVPYRGHVDLKKVAPPLLSVIRTLENHRRCRMGHCVSARAFLCPPEVFFFLRCSLTSLQSHVPGCKTYLLANIVTVKSLGVLDSDGCYVFLGSRSEIRVAEDWGKVPNGNTRQGASNFWEFSIIPVAPALISGWTS